MLINARDRMLELIKDNPKHQICENVFFEDIAFIANKINSFPGKIVGLLFDKTENYVKSFLAAFLSNKTILILDVKNPENRLLKYILETKPNIILTELKHKKLLESLSDSVRNSDFTVFEEYFVDSCEKIIGYPILENREEVYRIYTSGSTGEPKCVIIKDENDIYNVIRQQINILELNEENIFLYLSISFDAFISDLLCGFFSKSKFFINDEILLKRKSLHEFFISNNITYCDLPPSILSWKLPFKKMLIGGEVALKQDVQYYLKQGTKVLNVYGPTECTICTSFILCNNNWEPNNIGFPLRGIEYKIVENELWIHGHNGFYTNDELNKKKIVVHEDKTWFKTGDHVVYNGEYLYKGRIDRQIKHNGQLIALEEVENCAKSIINGNAVVIYSGKIHLIHETDCSPEFIRDRMQKILPSYMIPHLIEKKQILKTITGKNNVKYMAGGLNE